MSKTEKNQELAAVKAGMDPKTARDYLVDPRVPSERKTDRTWRTRSDAFNEVWDEVREQVSVNPGLEAKTLFEALQRKYPGRFADGQVRTLQRRLKQCARPTDRNGKCFSRSNTWLEGWVSPTSRT